MRPAVAAAFLGAALLFSVEPLIGKLVLPLLGGAPAVWNTCLLFFQGMLLAGYAYAHFGIRLLGLRRHAVLHIVIVVVSLLLLPPAVAATDAPAAGSPVAWLLLVLLRAVGLPFFVLSATAPLVQRWFAASAHPAARDPYFLYAASNLGSLVGLVLYPFALEPFTGLAAQATGWAVVYGAFALLIAGLAVAARRAAADPAVTHVRDTTVSTVPTLAAPPTRPSVRSAATWTAVAFVPSALLLTVTGYVTTDVAPMPLLWLLPLALYLLTFVVAFGVRDEAALRAAIGRIRLVQPLLVVVVGGAVLVSYNAGWMLPLHLTALTVAAFIAHARLALERPPATQLTAFYLWISVGGTLGGVFGAIVAPLLLMPEPEYALLLVAALLLPGPHASVLPRRGPVLVATTVTLAAALIAILAERPAAGLALFAVALTLLLARVDVDARRVGLAILLGIFLAGLATRGSEGAETRELARDRNFFGTLRVREYAEHRTLVHGRTLHGAQITTAGSETTPTTYYSREGPLGDAVALLPPAPARIGVVGLGAGTTVCHGRPGDEWDLYEIDPAVARMAADPRLFTFLPSCAPDARVIIGDGRRSLELREAAAYDLLVLDAFSSDAIPAHLLTVEAFRLYAARLAPGGLLAVHVSNRHLVLAPVVAANAAALGLAAVARHDDERDGVARVPSQWVVISAEPERVIPLVEDAEGWQRLEPVRGVRRWTDDYTSLLRVLSFRP